MSVDKIGLEEKVRPIHYLGSKLRLLDEVKEVIDEVNTKNGIIVDIFAGSGSVSKYMSKYSKIIANDIQEYSKVILEALLKSNSDSNFDIENFIQECKNSKKFNILYKKFTPIINYEEECISKAISDEREIFALCEFVEYSSYFKFIRMQDENLSKGLIDALKMSTINKEIKEYDFQITNFFGGIYFSYKQTVYLDSILNSLKDDKTISEENKIKIKAAVLSTASEIVNTIGKQFAQPLKTFDKYNKPKKSVINNIKKDRELKVFDIFKKWFNYYNSINNKYENEVYKKDYRDLLISLKNRNDIGVIYADPPYTRYHYSRYYHVLETIVLRDNPDITTVKKGDKLEISKGLYRKDRHQSPFSIKTKAAGALRKLVKGSHKLNANLIISYSPYDSEKKEAPRLLSIEEILEVAREFYLDVSLINIGNFSHSKLNSTEFITASAEDAEVLIVCKGLK